MNWFVNCRNEAEIKTEYRKHALRWHPDMPGGDTATMQDINAQYEQALLGDYRKQGMDEEKAQARWTMDVEVAAKAMELARLSRELIVEVCGVWLWITGATKQYKEQLKAMACRWSPKKEAWYFRREQDGGRRWHRNGRYTMQEIRMRYGSTTIDGASASQDCLKIA